MKLTLIIVSYNTSLLLKECLTSVYKALEFDGILKDSEVIVVDNASSDNSVDMVRKGLVSVRP